MDPGHDRPILPDSKLREEGGKIWRTKTHNEVPSSNHSLTDVQDYVKELPQDHAVEYTDASKHPQYKSMIDFVTTMRMSCEAKGTAFKWPQYGLTTTNSFSVALTHMPPGHMVSLLNSAPIPLHVQRPKDRARKLNKTGGLVVGDSEDQPIESEDEEEFEDDTVEDNRKKYLHSKPQPASSTWAGRFFSPYWWRGAGQVEDETLEEEEAEEPIE